MVDLIQIDSSVQIGATEEISLARPIQINITGEIVQTVQPAYDLKMNDGLTPKQKRRLRGIIGVEFAGEGMLRHRVGEEREGI